MMAIPESDDIPSIVRNWVGGCNWRGILRVLRQRMGCHTLEGMDKTIRKYASFDEMKTDDYREWQELPGYERLNAAAELSLGLYQAKEPTGDVQPRLQRTLVHLQRLQS